MSLLWFINDHEKNVYYVLNVNIKVFITLYIVVRETYSKVLIFYERCILHYLPPAKIQVD